jgi:hypothetical protein
MSNDMFADKIKQQVQEGKPPKAPKQLTITLTMRAWVALFLCAECLGAILALSVNAIIH